MRWRAGCGRSEETQYGSTVEAIEQPIAVPASSPVGALQAAMSNQEEAADYCGRMYQVRGALCVACPPLASALRAPRGRPAPGGWLGPPPCPPHVLSRGCSRPSARSPGTPPPPCAQIRKTCSQMLQDRGFEVPERDRIESFEVFKTRCTDYGHVGDPAKLTMRATRPGQSQKRVIILFSVCVCVWCIDTPRDQPLAHGTHTRNTFTHICTHTGQEGQVCH